MKEERVLEQTAGATRDMAAQMLKVMDPLAEMLAEHYEIEHHPFEDMEFRKA